jgi:hypothetical protein
MKWRHREKKHQRRWFYQKQMISTKDININILEKFWKGYPLNLEILLIQIQQPEYNRDNSRT